MLVLFILILFLDKYLNSFYECLEYFYKDCKMQRLYHLIQCMTYIMLPIALAYLSCSIDLIEAKICMNGLN